MPKDAPREARLEDLSDEEVERIEGEVFCCGGPPQALSRRVIDRACRSAPPTERAEPDDPGLAETLSGVA